MHDPCLPACPPLQCHWTLPRKVLGIEIRSLLFNRAAAKALPPYYTAGAAARASALVTQSLKRALWWGLERASKKAFKVPEAEAPLIKMPMGLFYGGQVGCGRGRALLSSALAWRPVCMAVLVHGARFMTLIHAWHSLNGIILVVMAAC